MTDRQAFLALICERPDDPTPRLIYADWLDDQGEYGEAEAWRWLVENKKWPGPNGWWPKKLGRPLHCTLPFDNPPEHPFRFLGTIYRVFRNPIEAYQAAVDEFLKQRAAGWRPTYPTENMP